MGVAIQWLELLRFEGRFHARKLAFAAAAAFFAFFGFLLAAAGYAPPEVHLNAPHSIAQGMGLLSLAAVFALTLFAAQATLRDGEHRMAEIVWTTGVTRSQMLFGRYAGSILTGTAACAMSLPGMVAGAWLVPHDPSKLGPFDALDYLVTFAILVVPNLLLVGAVLFAVAALTGSRVATFVAGVLLYVLYFAAAAFTDSPLMAASAAPTEEGLKVAALLDPFGISAFFEQTHYHSAAERNTLRLALEGPLLANRALWTAVAAGILGLTYRFFRFRLPAGSKRTARQEAPSEARGPSETPDLLTHPA